MDDGFEDLLNDLETDNASRGGGYSGTGNSAAPVAKKDDLDLDDMLNDMEQSNPHNPGPRKPQINTACPGDDLDSLLDGMSPVGSYDKPRSSKTASRPTGGDDMDDLLGDLVLSSNSPSAPTQYQPQPSASVKIDSPPAAGKSRINCLTCDLQAVGFGGYKWADDVDYLFMRYNYHNLQKLQPKLNASDAHIAYGCGCSWRTMGRHDPLDEAAGTQVGCGEGRWIQC